MFKRLHGNQSYVLNKVVSTRAHKMFALHGIFRVKVMLKFISRRLHSMFNSIKLRLNFIKMQIVCKYFNRILNPHVLSDKTEI